MAMENQGENHYKGMISSDWNECLAPCGPFDPIAFACPVLEADLSLIFRKYTGNQISLSEATRLMDGLLPEPITEKRMDAYLDASFVTYTGVRDLIEWCMKQNILFMINTTGMQGYFQRAMAKGLLPQGIVVAANPMISYAAQGSDRCYCRSSPCAVSFRSYGLISFADRCDPVHRDYNPSRF